MAELMGRQNNVGFTYYGERLQRLRKTLHASLNTKAVTDTWSNMLEAQSLALCRHLFRSPTSFVDSIEINIQELIGRFSYGHKPDAEYIRVANDVMHHTGQALRPGRWMVDSVPALKWIPSWMPGAGFKRWAMEANSVFIRMTREPFYNVKKDMEYGRAKPSFVANSLMSLPEDHDADDEDIIMYAAGSLFSAGTETLSGAILTFLVLMACHEDVQERAYQEIITVVGRDLLPGLEHRQSLRYVDVLIQEVHRFNPAVPLATHSNYQEEDYLGHRIPKKTWILANIWAMLHDESDYPNPGSFNPERFLAVDDKNAQLDPRSLLRCPGAHFADAIVYLIVSRILTLFVIRPKIKEGRPNPPVLEFIQAFVPAPKPFECDIVPRDNAAEMLGVDSAALNGSTDF
ncbi:cytochrome P450 [Stereum hirsutum FP-91666 SS1]|uniref:cytochrome P450 n=1 Tax=Stereum hirsutum (strain FP-91666) TaxID=721885 RepID=UPI000444A84D|nr:cytochrome P450 [Stereum hirsutum FP-91666 SS1]EIM81805.1 cytochrome P450 [Stereum hirsutum FP-91666 SS1]